MHNEHYLYGTTASGHALHQDKFDKTLDPIKHVRQHPKIKISPPVLFLYFAPPFSTFARGEGGGRGRDTPSVSKLSVVELSGKLRRIALDE